MRTIAHNWPGPVATTPTPCSSVAQAILGEWDVAYDAFATLDWTGIGLARRLATHIAPSYGQLLLDRGEHQQAEELLRSQWEYCRNRDAITLELNLLPPLCESYLRLGRLEDAHKSLGRAQEILATPEEWRGLTARVALAEALLAAAESRWREAEAAFQRAVETNQQYGLLYDQARAMFQWAVMYLDRADSAQDHERCLGLLDQSVALFQRCDAKKDIERVIARKDGFRP